MQLSDAHKLPSLYYSWIPGKHVPLEQFFLIRDISKSSVQVTLHISKFNDFLKLYAH